MRHSATAARDEETVQRKRIRRRLLLALQAEVDENREAFPTPATYLSGFVAVTDVWTRAKEQADLLPDEVFDATAAAYRRVFRLEGLAALARERGSSDRHDLAGHLRERADSATVALEAAADVLKHWLRKSDDELETELSGPTDT